MDISLRDPNVQKKLFKMIMRKLTFPAIVVLVILISCRSTNRIVNDRMDQNQLNGTWQLEYIADSSDTFRGFYPSKQPTISFMVNEKRVNGNTGCNSFGGPFTIDGFNVDFNGPITSTRMACPGSGEQVFFANLKKVTRFAVTDSTTLNLLMADEPVMRFHKIPG